MVNNSNSFGQVFKGQEECRGVGMGRDRRTRILREIWSILNLKQKHSLRFEPFAYRIQARFWEERIRSALLLSEIALMDIGMYTLVYNQTEPSVYGLIESNLKISDILWQ